MSPVLRLSLAKSAALDTESHVLTGIAKSELEQMHAWVIKQGFQRVPPGSWAPSCPALFNEFADFIWYVALSSEGLFLAYLHRTDSLMTPREELAYIEIENVGISGVCTLEQFQEEMDFQVRRRHGSLQN